MTDNEKAIRKKAKELYELMYTEIGNHLLLPSAEKLYHSLYNFNESYQMYDTVGNYVSRTKEKKS